MKIFQYSNFKKRILKNKLNFSWNYHFKKNFCKSVKDTSEETTIDSDIIIVGGGVVGLSLVSALLKTDYFGKERIILIDQPSKINSNDFTYNRNRIPDARVVSLTPSSIRFLKSIGHWDSLDQRLIKYINGMQIWENKGSSYVHMNIKDNSSLKNFFNFFSNNNTLFTVPKINTEYICAVVEINHLINGFNKILKDSKQLKILNQVLEYDNIELENTEEYVYLKLNKEKIKYRSKLIISSDGAKSVIRNKLKLQTKGYEYNDTGLVATFRGNKASDIAYQRFLHNGIFALLPMYDDLYSIVCSMPKIVNENLKSLDEKTFLNVVNRILHDPSESDLLSNKFDRVIPIENNFSHPPILTELLSKRLEFNLQLLQSVDTVYKNIILIGDAAHVVHPMAGQGMNLGITDSALLANELVNSLQIGRRLNDKRSLDSFSFKSQISSRSMVTIIELLKLLFTPVNYPFAELRNLGMSLSNKSEYLKSVFMTAASGELIQPQKYPWENDINV